MPGHQFARSLPLQFMRPADSLFIQVINRSLARSPWGTRTAPTYRTNRIRHSAFSAFVPSATVRLVDHQGCRSPNCRELSSPRTQNDQPGGRSLDGSNLAEPGRNAAPPAPHSHEGNVKHKGLVALLRRMTYTRYGVGLVAHVSTALGLDRSNE